MQQVPLLDTGFGMVHANVGQKVLKSNILRLFLLSDYIDPSLPHPLAEPVLEIFFGLYCGMQL
jgi:hypothetical protein